MSCLKGYFKVFAVCAMIAPMPLVAQEVQPVEQTVEQAAQPTIPVPPPSGQSLQSAVPNEGAPIGVVENSQVPPKNVLIETKGSLIEGAPSERVAAVAQEIAQINQRIALLSARYAEIEMQAKITEKLAEIKKINNPDKKEEKQAEVKSIVNTVGVQPRVEEFPAVSLREISGVDGDLGATLNLRNGNIQRVKVNDKISGWVVKDIRVDYVEVEKNGKSSKLFLGNFSQTSSSYNRPASIPPMPPVSLVSPSLVPISIQ